MSLASSVVGFAAASNGFVTILLKTFLLELKREFRLLKVDGTADATGLSSNCRVGCRVWKSMEYEDDTSLAGVPRPLPLELMSPISCVPSRVTVAFKRKRK